MIMITSQIFATTYYVDATNGNDNTSGTSPSAAWKTIAKVNNSYFNPGDFILFKRGEVWREQLIVPSSGSPGHPITFGAYGSGNKPILFGSLPKSNKEDWIYLGSNKWATANNSFPNDVHMVFYNTTTKPTSPDWGIKVANENDLDTDWEFWYDSTNKRVVIYHSSGNPANQASGIEVTNKGGNYIVYVNKANITVDGLDIRYTDYRGVGVAAGSDNVTIKNCDLYCTYANGVSCYNSNNTILDNLYLKHCGIKGKVENSSGENIWISEYASKSSITVKNCEIDTPHAVPINIWHADNVIVENNYIHDSDYYTGSWH